MPEKPMTIPQANLTIPQYKLMEAILSCKGKSNDSLAVMLNRSENKPRTVQSLIDKGYLELDDLSSLKDEYFLVQVTALGFSLLD